MIGLPPIFVRTVFKKGGYICVPLIKVEDKKRGFFETLFLRSEYSLIYRVASAGVHFPIYCNAEARANFTTDSARESRKVKAVIRAHAQQRRNTTLTALSFSGPFLNAHPLRKLGADFCADLHA